MKFSLRARIVLLVVVAIAPLFGMSIYKALHGVDAAVAEARRNMMMTASLLADSQQRIAESSRQVLTVLASLPGMADDKTRDCDHYFSNLLKGLPAYSNLGLIDLDGNTRCHALGSENKVYLGDRLYFRDAIRLRRFVAGEYMQGRLTGAYSIAYAQPLISVDGRLAGVLFAVLNVSEIAHSIADIDLPAGAATGIHDRHGVLLAGRPDLPIKSGQMARSPVVLEAVKNWSTGTDEGLSGAKKNRLWAFKPSSPSQESGVLVVVSADRALVVGPGLRAFWFELAMLALVTGLSGWLAWVLAGRGILGPTRKIYGAIRALEKGQFDTRISMRPDDGGDEFAKIASGFNLMADSLVHHEQKLVQELSRSQQAYATLELTLNSMQEGLLAVDTTGWPQQVNQTALQFFVVDDLPRVLDVLWPQKQGFFVPGTQTLYSVEQLPLYKALQGESGGPLLVCVRNARAPAGRLINCRYRPMLDGERVVGALMVFTDVTQLEQLQAERVRSYEAMAEVQRKLLQAQRIGHFGSWELDLGTNKLWWSDEVYALYGVDPEAFDGSPDSVAKRVHPDDRADYERRRETAMRDGLPLDTEYRIVTAEGQIRWIVQYGELVCNNEGVPRMRAGVVRDITLQRASQDHLRLLEAALAKLDDHVLILDAQPADGSGAKIVYANEAFERHTGYSRSEVLGRSPSFLTGPKTDVAQQAYIREKMRKRVPVRSELIYYKKNREEYVVENKLVPITDSKGRLTHLVSVGRDITQRKLAQQALQESEQRYTALFEAAPVPMWVADFSSGRYLLANQAAVDAYGYSQDEFLRMTLFDIRPESEHERMREEIRAPADDHSTYWLHQRKDGATFYVSVVSKPVQYQGSEARFVVAVDMSRQVAAEQEVHANLKTMQGVADAAQAITWHQTLDATLQEVADQAREVIGAHQAVASVVYAQDWANSVNSLSLSEKYKDFRGMAEAPTGDGIYALVSETNQSLRLTQAELEAHPRWRGFGSYAAKHAPMRGWLAVPLTGRAGKNIGLLQLSDKYEGEFTQQDEYAAQELAQLASFAIENARLLEAVGELNAGLEQKVAERTAALTRQEALALALAEQAPQIVWHADAQGRVTFVNRKWYDLVGGDPSEPLVSADWMSAVHPDDLPDMRAAWEAAVKNQALYTGMRRLRSKYGEYHTMSYRASPVLDDKGAVSFWVGIDADVTEIKAIESALRLSNQELEAFSYSVSHDLRSPLNTVDGFSRLLAKQLEAGKADEKVKHYLSRINAGVGQMGRLIEDLLSLAQVSRMQLRYESVDLSAVAGEIVADCQDRDPERVAKISIQDGLRAQGDARLIRVALENLIGNAWKFSAQQACAEITVGCEAANGGMAFFVRDNGAGFDMAYADKLFQTFQRLHAATEFPGTGVGLATVSRVVGRHRGHVWVQAELGKGATFYFTLSGAGYAPPNLSRSEHTL